MEAPVPRDDWWPRRTWEWNEPGPKAKEWGTERPWTEWESRAFSLFVFNRELSTPGSPQILRLKACPAFSGPGVCFHGGLSVCTPVAGAGPRPGEAAGGRRWGAVAPFFPQPVR